MKRFIGPGAIAFLAIWIVLLAGGRTAFLRDPGTYWHITTGERILHSGFLRSDPYTFTFADTWWVPYQWLGEVGMALAHRAAGFDALLLGAVTIIASVFAWLAVRLWKTGLNPIATGAVVFFALAASSAHFHVRPHLFTIAGMAVTMVFLLKVESGQWQTRKLFWLVPFFAIWVNVHGGVLGGMATVVLAAAGWIALRRIGGHSPLTSFIDDWWVAVIAAACCLTGFVNPYGLDLIRTWHVIMGEPVLREIIQEHSAMKFTEPSAWPTLGFAAFYIFILLGVPRHQWRVTWLLPLVWFVLSLDRVRHAPLFAVSALAALAYVWPESMWAKRLAAKRPDFYQPGADRRTPLLANFLLPVAAVSLVFFLEREKIEVPVVGANWAKHDPEHWPVDLLPALKQHEPHDGRNRIFNGYIDGGFLIYYVPGYKVFVDDRCEVFGGAWLKEFVLADSNDTAAAIAKWEKQYGPFHYALARAGTGFEKYFESSAEWERVQRTPIASFFKRK